MINSQNGVETKDFNPGFLYVNIRCLKNRGGRVYNGDRTKRKAESEGLSMLSDNIKGLRVARGLSQEELAWRLSVVRQTVSKWEKGLSQPDADMLVTLARVLEVSVTDLLGETAVPALDIPVEGEHKGMKTLKTILIILGFPVWFSLLIAAFSVVLALYVSLWAVILSLWAAFVSLAIGPLSALLLAIYFGITGHGLTALSAVAAGLVCGGLAILLFLGCRAATKGARWLTGRMARMTKARRGKKEVAA